MKNLKRKLSFPYIIAIGIGGMLGSGIFVLPGIAAAKTGESIWIAYLCAAICIIPAVLSKSELATAMPKSGGAYVYIERAFGPLLGTISGLGLWLSLLLKSSFALVGFGAYLMIIVNLESIPIKYISISFLIIIMMLNILGIKKVGKVQLIVVSISIIGLISILILGLPIIDGNVENQFLLYGNSGLISTIAFVYISYAGVTKVAAIAGEVKNPSKTLPVSMILSLIIISTIYILVTYTLVHYVPVDQLESDYKPIYTLSKIIGGEWFAYIIAIIGVMTLVSMANSGVLASSRFPFAMATDKLLPNTFTNLHKKYLTPINTIILTCIIMALVIYFLDVNKIAKLASAFKVCMFIAVNLCVIILRETAVQWYQPTYKSPLYPYVQLFGIITGLILLFYLGLMPILVVLSVGCIGTLIYFIYGKKASRSGVLINYGHIPALFLFFNKEFNFKKSRIIKTSHTIIDKENNLDNFQNKVIITLLGNERSPEMITEVGASLNKDESVKVLDIIEVPDQTSLEALYKETPQIRSKKRQIRYIGDKNNMDISFIPLTTHNVSETIQDISINSDPNWIVLEWNGRAHDGILIKNPLGWIVSNINSNFALFKDNGIKYISKIVLAIRPNSEDLEKMIEITSNISKFYNVKFSLMQIVSSESDLDIKDIKQRSRNLSSKYKYIDKIIIDQAEDPIDYISNISAEYDLLILGTPKKDSWKTMLFGSGTDLLATQANCSVLRLTIKTNDTYITEK